MTRFLVTGILVGTITLAGIALARDQMAFQRAASTAQMRTDKQVPLPPEILLQEINALKTKVASLQQQVVSLQAGAASTSTHANRLAKLESILTIDASGGVTIASTTRIRLDTNLLEANAGSVTVNSGMNKFSGIVQADKVITNSVVSSSYTPGAGNIW